MSFTKYHIDTYGCQMNEHDSEKMAALLEKMGLSWAESPDDADIVLINTCAIREKAEHKVYSALGKLRSIKEKKAHLITVVSGCVAQQEQERLLKKANHLDLVLGTHMISMLPDLIQEIRQDRGRKAVVEFSDDVESLHQNAPHKGKSRVCSYLTIMQGCSNFCTYCVVPYTRGPEQSRRRDEIMAEAKGLAEQGVREITLLGQNVNAYGKDLNDCESFSELLTQLNSVDQLLRIRFTTSHPKDLDAETIIAMSKLAKVCEHIHLPLQTGSDRILKKMNRGYSIQEYMDKIASLREAIPDIAITADMIVGFPGETDDDFQETLYALERIKYDQIFSFKYSPRPQTAALKMSNHVQEDIKSKRLALVHELQDKITLEKHLKAQGTIEEVLVEGIRPASGQYFGRTRSAKIVNIVPGKPLKNGDLAQVRITQGMKHSLLGEIV